MDTGKKETNQDFRKIEIINVTIMGLAYISLFFSGFISQNPSYNQIVGILGWGIWISGLLLAFSPNVALKKRGGVPKGKSYIHTTELVSDGIFGIIRHPQYTGGLVIAFSICLIIQTPLTYVLAIIAMITAYLSMVFEEERLVTKFGPAYETYMTEVPRANFFIGIRRRFKKS